ncbi:MAG: PEP-utilizing enzyme [Limnohabitans sp.]|nr:PEP-utilizing enzyme [Limnohabitans sp.]
MSIAFLGNACNAIQKKYLSQYDYTHVEPILVLQKGNQAICHFDLEMYRNFSLVSYKRIKDSVYSLPEYKKYQEIISQINTEYNNFALPESNTDSKSKITLYFELAKELIASTLFAESVDHYIVEILAKEVGVKDVDMFTKVSTQATKPSFVIHFNELLLKSKDISWSFTNYFSAPTANERLELVKQKAAEISVEDLTLEIQKTNETIIKNKQSIQNLIENSSTQQKNLIEFIQAAINIRDERKEFVLKLFTMMSDVLRVLAENYSLSYEAISTIGDTEIDLLEDPKFIQLLERRSKLGVANISYYDKADIFTVDYGKAVKKIFGNVENIKEIKGISANKGLYTGTVKIVLTEDIFDQFKEGEVLVTGMTRAEYVPLMKKSGAIITDEGGVTCHAAIVSRELGIPCVIGTKFATQIFKDGDMVEVDANNGVVRIIKKKELLKRDDWYHLGKWDGATLGAEVWFRYSEITKNFIKGDLNGGLIYLNGDFFLCKNDTETYIKETYDHAKNKDINYFKNLKSKIIKEADIFIDYSKSEKDLVSFLGKLQEFHGYWMPLNNMAVGLEKYVNETNPDFFTQAIGLTCEKPWTLEQVDEMRKIKSQINKKNYEELLESEKSLINEHVNKYKWKGSHLFSVHSFTVGELFQQMKDDNHQESSSKINKEIEVQMLDILAFIRFRCAEAVSKAVQIAYPIFLQVAEKNNLTYQELLEHTINEIETKDFNKQRAQKRIINKGFVYDGEITILNDQQIEEYKSILLAKDNISRVDTLKGLIAQKGKATGIVKIINNKDDVDGFEEGMVIVSYETTPDFVHIMKKSSAIITNFGGLTSHAAIIAREFKVPCIVGTKFATEILKDGDEVEVDADNGTVRILEKTSSEENIIQKFVLYTEGQELFPPMHNISLACFSVGVGKFIHDYFDLPTHIAGFFIPSDQNNHIYHVSLTLLKQMTRQAFYRYFETKDRFKEPLDIFEKNGRALIEMFDLKIKEMEDGSISNGFLIDMHNKVHELNAISWFSAFLDQDLTWQMIEENNLGISKYRFEKIWNDISYPYHLSLEKRREKYALKAIADGLRLEEVAKKYFYFYQNYDQYTPLEKGLDFFKKEYASLSSEKALEKYHELYDQEVILKDKYNNIHKNLDNKDERTLFEFLQLTIRVRDERKDYLAAALCMSYVYYDYVLKIPMDTIDAVLPVDINNNGQLITSIQDIKRRKEQATVLVLTNGSIYIDCFASLSEGKKALSNLYKIKETKEIKGSTAFGGKVQGIAKIIRNPKKQNFYEGDILITDMTRPEFVPLMKKASAIVTDQGGITCHAAIISRELKKPCVIGTKFATQILKDGDLVEVDANKGTVTKLS